MKTGSGECPRGSVDLVAPAMYLTPRITPPNQSGGSISSIFSPQEQVRCFSPGTVAGKSSLQEPQ